MVNDEYGEWWVWAGERRLGVNRSAPTSSSLHPQMDCSRSSLPGWSQSTWHWQQCQNEATNCSNLCQEYFAQNIVSGPPNGRENGIWQLLSRTYHMSAVRAWKWKRSNGFEKSEIDLFWCISMTNNLKSCKKIDGRHSDAVFLRWDCAENVKKPQN